MSQILHPVGLLVGMTVFLWLAAVWATLREERRDEPLQGPLRRKTEDHDLAA
jgi:hypothetical protein